MLHIAAKHSGVSILVFRNCIYSVSKISQLFADVIQYFQAQLTLLFDVIFCVLLESGLATEQLHAFFIESVRE